MSDDQIRILLAAYLSGNIAEKDREDIESWIQASDANRLVADEARRIWEHSSAKLTIDDPATEKEWERLWSRISNDSGKGRAISLFSNRYLKFAAAIALIVVVYWAVRPQEDGAPDYTGEEAGLREENPSVEGEGKLPAVDPPAHDQTASVEEAKEPANKGRGKRPTGSDKIVASESKVETLYLPDSTRVWLNVNSTLSHSAGFGHEVREVVLTGQAYFEVTPDANREFIVRGKGVTVRVVGTAFDMEAYDSTVTITVAEGKVAVFEEGSASKNLLSPGEKAVRVKSAGLVKSKNTNPRFDAWRTTGTKIAVPERAGTESSLVVEYSWKKNDFNQSVITGTLRNETGNKTYKNITLKITSVKSNGREVTSQVTVYETVLPGDSTEYRTTLMDMFTNTEDLRVEVEKAEIITTPIR